MEKERSSGQVRSAPRAPDTSPGGRSAAGHGTRRIASGDPVRGAPPQSPRGRWSTLIRQPRTLWLLGTLLVFLVAVPTVTWRWVQRDRAELVDRFARERLVALRLVAREVEEDVRDVIDDLRFVVRIVRASAHRGGLRPLLLALLGTSRSYRGLVVNRGTGKPWIRIPDPARPLPDPGRFDRDVRAAMARLSRRDAPPIVVSPLIEIEQGWFRVFATRLPGTTGGVAMLVDMQPHLNKLRLAAVDPQTRILVLGPNGAVVPASDAVMQRALAHGRAAVNGSLRALLTRMRKGGEGTLQLSRAEAIRLRLGRAELVAAYHPIRLQVGGHWSVATLTSIATIQEHERSLLLRFGLGSGAVMLLLLGIGSYVLHAGYRQAALLEQVRHAEVEAHLHEKAQKTLESIPSGVIVLGEDDLVTDVNRALRERLPESAVGRHLVEALGDEAADARHLLVELVEDARRSGAPQSVVLEHLVLFGAEGHYRLHAVPLEPSSPQASMLLVVDDITELKALEEQLLRTEKLSTVGTLAAGIAHEIGTPLSVVRGRSEYILGKLEPDHPHAAGLRIVIDQTDRIIRTVRELLDFSRVSPAQPSGVDAAAVVGKCVELLRYEAHRRQITLATELAPGLPPLAADPDQLQQVVVNLMMNAIDASEPGGEVTVRALLEPPAPTEPNRRTIRLEVQDRGAGIAPEILHRIYDPFFTTKKRGQGTGLGLFITANIVRSHLAYLDLLSAPGGGTRAVLRWPVHHEGSHAETS